MQIRVMARLRKKSARAGPDNDLAVPGIRAAGHRRPRLGKFAGRGHGQRPFLVCATGDGGTFIVEGANFVAVPFAGLIGRPKRSFFGPFPEGIADAPSLPKSHCAPAFFVSTFSGVSTARCECQNNPENRGRIFYLSHVLRCAAIHLFGIQTKGIHSALSGFCCVPASQKGRSG